MPANSTKLIHKRARLRFFIKAMSLKEGEDVPT